MCHSEWDGMRTNMRVNDRESVFVCYRETDSKEWCGRKKGTSVMVGFIASFECAEGFLFHQQKPLSWKYGSVHIRFAT